MRREELTAANISETPLIAGRTIRAYRDEIEARLFYPYWERQALGLLDGKDRLAPLLGLKQRAQERGHDGVVSALIELDPFAKFRGVEGVMAHVTGRAVDLEPA